MSEALLVVALRVRRMLIADEQGRAAVTAVDFHVMLLLFFFGSGKGCQVGSLDGEMTN